MSLADINDVKNTNDGFSDFFTLAGYVALENQLTEGSGDVRNTSYETQDARTPLTQQGVPTQSKGMSNKTILITGGIIAGVGLLAYILKG